MKVLCIADEGIKAESFEKACRLFFGDAEIVVETDTELNKNHLPIIESQGPGAVRMPAAFQKHPDAEIAIGSILCPFSAEIMDTLPNLRVIGTCRGGLENVDMDAAKARHIMVVNGFGRNAEAVSDFTLAIMLSEIRNVARSYANLSRQHETWRNQYVNEAYVPHMKEIRVGIFGFGNIGRLVAKKLTGFGSEIAVYDPFVSDDEVRALGYVPVTKEELFAQSDVVTIHARLVDATRGIIGKDDIDRMKPTAFFVNTARAGLVDYDALLAALQEKRIGGAALDVFPEEPLPADSVWRTLDNCTITEHIAGAVLASRAYAARLVAESITMAMKGMPAPQIITKDLMQDSAFQVWAQDAMQQMHI